MDVTLTGNLRVPGSYSFLNGRAVPLAALPDFTYGLIAFVVLTFCIRFFCSRAPFKRESFFLIV